MNESLELDMDAVADFVQNELMADGILVKKDDILRIFDLEFEYMLENGFVVEME